MHLRAICLRLDWFFEEEPEGAGAFMPLKKLSFEGRPSGPDTHPISPQHYLIPPIFPMQRCVSTNCQIARTPPEIPTPIRVVPENMPWPDIVSLAL
jgi:hypothetical protein